MARLSDHITVDVIRIKTNEFICSMEYNNGLMKWQILKSSSSIMELSRGLAKSLNDSADLPQPPQDLESCDTTLIADYLKSLASHFNERFFSIPMIANFMDESGYPLSPFASARFKFMEEQINVLREYSNIVNEKLSQSESQISQIFGTLDNLQQQISINAATAATAAASSASAAPTASVAVAVTVNPVTPAVIHSDPVAESDATTSLDPMISSENDCMLPTEGDDSISIQSHVQVLDQVTSNDGLASDETNCKFASSSFEVRASGISQNNFPSFMFNGSYSFAGSNLGMGELYPSDSAPQSDTFSDAIPAERAIAISVQSKILADMLPTGLNDSDNELDNSSSGRREELAAVPVSISDDAFDFDFSKLATTLAVIPVQSTNAVFRDGNAPVVVSVDRSTHLSSPVNQAPRDCTDTAQLDSAMSMGVSKAIRLSGTFNPEQVLQIGESSYNIAEFFTISDDPVESESLPLALIPCNEIPSASDEVIENIVAIIQPHSAQLNYRSSAKEFILKQVKQSLGSKLFEIGLHALKCFLPDDPIRLSVILWRNNSGNWHTHLSDRLCRISENGKFVDEEVVDQAFDEGPPPIDHNISNVSYTNNNSQNEEFRIFCVLDSLGVEIACNTRIDICLLAFIEEFSTLVGRDLLFKRSLLLIRAWWVYETMTYIGNPMKHYIPDYSLCVMVIAIFNRYHDRIFSPLQAICFFLAEYADIDWMNCAITLQGVVPFRPNYENQPWLALPTAHHLLSEEIIEKYVDLLYFDNSDSESESVATAAAAQDDSLSSAIDDSKTVDTSSPDVTQNSEEVATGTLTLEEEDGLPLSNDGADGDGLGLDSIIDGERLDTRSHSSSLGDIKGSDNSKPSSSSSSSKATRSSASSNEKKNFARKAAITNFEKRGVNIVHPLCFHNMMNDKLNSRRAKRIAKVFQKGAKDLHAALRLLSSSGVISTQTSFHNYFRGTLTRFGNGWRPDVMGNAVFTKSRGPDNSDLNSVNWGEGWQNEASNAMLSQKILNGESTVESMNQFDDHGNDTCDGDSENGESAESMTVSLERLWDQIHFCNLILEGRITETALLILTKEILSERGTLPVGEIGKMLQELSSMTSLSSKLKEKFGGLKKFLEKFSDHYIIGTDHPFNPHVYLRQSLTADDLEAIALGTVPPQLLAKFKKMIVVRKKKATAVPTSSGTSSLNPIEHNPWNALGDSNSIEQSAIGLSQPSMSPTVLPLALTLMPPPGMSLLPQNNPNNNILGITGGMAATPTTSYTNATKIGGPSGSNNMSHENSSQNPSASHGRLPQQSLGTGSTFAQQYGSSGAPMGAANGKPNPPNIYGASTASSNFAANSTAANGSSNFNANARGSVLYSQNTTAATASRTRKSDRPGPKNVSAPTYQGGGGGGVLAPALSANVPPAGMQGSYSSKLHQHNGMDHRSSNPTGNFANRNANTQRPPYPSGPPQQAPTMQSNSYAYSAGVNNNISGYMGTPSGTGPPYYFNQNQMQGQGQGQGQGHGHGLPPPQQSSNQPPLPPPSSSYNMYNSSYSYRDR